MLLSFSKEGDVYKRQLLCLSSIGITSWGRNATPTSHLTVLQLNIWHEGSIVEGGFEAIADEVAQVDADIVFFSEVRNYNGTLDTGVPPSKPPTYPTHHVPRFNWGLVKR